MAEVSYGGGSTLIGIFRGRPDLDQEPEFRYLAGIPALVNKKPDWGYENPVPVYKNRIKADKKWQKRQTNKSALVFINSSCQKY